MLLTSFSIVSSVTLINMWKSNPAFGAFAVAAYLRSSIAQCDPGSRHLDLTWHPPNATAINNLTAVINSTGAYGFRFDAATPSTVPYRTYNWCNMPHVRQQEYIVPSSEFKLEYVEVVSRPTSGRAPD